jgi:hypothetical protein
MTVNYLQWLITVVNDCVFYFIKKQEPVYAFHTLVLAEFYVKKILHKKSTDTTLFDLTNLEPKRPKQKPKRQKATAKTDAVSLADKFLVYTLKMCDPTHEVYEHQPGHPNSKCNPQKT